MSLENMKKRNTKIRNRLFNDMRIEGVYVTIFSYIPNNKSCYNFSLCNKDLWNCFKKMLEASSTRNYRLKCLNNENPQEYTIDIFKKTNFVNFTLENFKGYFVQSIEEFEKGLFGRTNQKVALKVLSKINKKHGRVCFVSGSHCVLNFLHKKNFLEHYNQMHDAAVSDGKKITKGWNSPNSNRKLNPTKSMKTNNDIDVFLLGKNKKRVLKDLLFELSVSLPYFRIVNRGGGLYDVYENYPRLRDYDSDEDNDKFIFSESYKEGEKINDEFPKLGKRYLPPAMEREFREPCIQLIVKELHSNPSDVFAFFDLDCCKIGYFPHFRETISCVGFIRSMVNRVNYIDLHSERAGEKHGYRIMKYFNRLQVFTTKEREPLLSYYHTFNNFNFTEREIKMWTKLECSNDHQRYYRKDYYNSSKLIKKKLVQLKDYYGQIEYESEKNELPYLATSVGIVKKEGIFMYEQEKKEEKGNYFRYEECEDYVRETIIFTSMEDYKKEKEREEERRKQDDDDDEEFEWKMASRGIDLGYPTRYSGYFDLY